MYRMLCTVKSNGDHANCVVYKRLLPIEVMWTML